MRLDALIKEIVPLATSGDLSREIGGIAFDSRKIKMGEVFVAVRGHQVDGHQFIDNAIENGAQAVICELPPPAKANGPAWVQVADSAQALGLLAAAYHRHPSRKLRLVGVTGTNGKTTTVTLLYRLFTRLGYGCGLLSTVENRIGAAPAPATHTTPDAVAINGLLADMVDAGCDYAFMEVSSHAIDQRRIAGLQFAGGVFTNITHDHLDYHRTFRAYIEAKKRFFDQLPAGAFALVNIDDKRGEVMAQNTRAKVYRYSLQRLADFRGRLIESSLTGLHMAIDGQEFHSRLIGKFNAYNLLATFGVAILLEQAPSETLAALSALESAAGRFDYLHDPKRRVAAIVDYAHTPDALEKALLALREVKARSASIITVVGCGGDRDRAKRPKMAQIACRLSQQVILTSDNPRSEDPEAIIRDMWAGLTPADADKAIAITDRAQAIKTACRLAQPGDVVLVAGKGHEQYQEIKGVKYPFDDKEVLKAELSL
jgi:UDP-N-acetylmuramoyl-L-alanyl-D-glutamate--2,6-diaminopimelate ligase